MPKHIIMFDPSMLLGKYFHDGGPYHIKTSPLISRANQSTGFYMIGNSVIKELSASSHYPIFHTHTKWSEWSCIFWVTRGDLGHRLLILQQSLLRYQFSKLNSTFFPTGKILLTCYLVLVDLLYTAVWWLLFLLLFR